MAKGASNYKTAEQMNEERRAAKARRRGSKKREAVGFTLMEYRVEKREKIQARRADIARKREIKQQRHENGQTLLALVRQRRFLYFHKSSPTYQNDITDVIHAAIASKRNGEGRFVWEYDENGLRIAVERQPQVA